MLTVEPLLSLQMFVNHFTITPIKEKSEAAFSKWSLVTFN